MPLCKLEIIDAIIQPKVIVPEDAWLGSLKAFQPDPQQWVPRPLQKELAALRLRVEELSAISPSTRRAPGSHEEEDPTMMSGGVGGPVNPSANAGSPYVRSGPTNDPVARRRADRAAEEDRRLALLRNQEEYDLLHARSPRVGSAARGRDVAPTHTPSTSRSQTAPVVRTPSALPSASVAAASSTPAN
ncbi:hypothetical protein M438DRAFT_338177 [Aureobasidium pullulans EXF-150]|uniref:Uncharacterized protein n=1 Tax=Aureobasidium pullulans EXF-150 TaxID=1043002 RepID=A0A074XH75_AURPU|nr:uncharacterized protein M438DRAFT_338177 [Aureobasidium pullulans EXF-150]KEQ81402.1 hypothetical protein M438DRAFT_338177 [Aureobasidium pullulans EXF-150]